jgi:hypothetical protein
MSTDDVLDADMIVIGDDEYENTLAEDVLINQGALHVDFIEHPQKFTKWATLYELALDKEIRLKNELQRMYAKVDFVVREEAAASAVKMTEKKVENSVVTHPKYLEVLEEYHDAKLQSGLLKAARDAMIHRRDMLIQLGATYRAEGQSDISIREQTAREVVGQK